jgi:hypothetical protein
MSAAPSVLDNTHEKRGDLAMSEKKQAPKKKTVLHSIKVGDITAIITTQQTNSGFVYKGFQLVRSFSASSGKQSRASSFFAKNARDVAQAALAACDWINREEQADVQTSKQTDTQ